jgi:glycosyltransferase involved in cell wall biosynthesis
VRTVAVYRWSLLPPSETFIRNQALALEGWSPIFAGEQRHDGGLELPSALVELGTPGGRPERVLRRRLLRRSGRDRLVQRCRARGVELVHAHFGPDGLAGLELADGLGVPLVVTFHGYDAMLHDDALRAAGPGFAAFVERRAELFARAALLIAVSAPVAEELVRRGAAPGKVAVHHIGVPVAPATAREPGDPTVLFVGRHVAKKGLPDLIEAMALVRGRVPGARLVVVGDGPLRAELEQRAAGVAPETRFAGWEPPEAVRDRMDAARVLCVPSRRAPDGDAEGLPTVIGEAGARGLPTVGTRHSGIPEALGDGAGGLLADEGDVAGLADALTQVLSDDAAWRRLSAGARRTVERDFDVARQGRELGRLYDRAAPAAG